MAGLVAVQVHHVGAIEATGVSIGLASTLGRIRGLLSLPGRAGAATLTNRVGIVNALRIDLRHHGASARSPSSPPELIAWVWIFVVLTGLAFGIDLPAAGSVRG